MRDAVAAYLALRRAAGFDMANAEGSCRVPGW